MFRKCRSQLRKTNIKKLCQDLSKMFPVSGKTNSFSLRTSAQLTHGIVLIYKYRLEVVRREVILMRQAALQGITDCS